MLQFRKLDNIQQNALIAAYHKVAVEHLSLELEKVFDKVDKKI
jgi:hypothetical protein